MNCFEAVRVDGFWGEVAPCEHLVQFYLDEGSFLATLERYVAEGLQQGEAIVAIATASHLSTLEASLRAGGFDLDALRTADRYVALDAAATLSTLISDGWPDEHLFRDVIGPVIERARGDDRRVRAFGEMVALLWAQGHHGATIRLESLWSEFCRRDGVAVFCAYPRIGATRDLEESLAEVCALHTQVAAAVI